jgi:uncharacterized membrane protein
MTDTGYQTTPPAKSSFVTVVAWVFIVLAGFATFLSLLQNLMVTLMPQDMFNAPLQDTTLTRVMPGAPRLIFAHLRLLVAAMLILCLVTLTSAVGLLRRRNWARVLFIVLLGLGVVYNIAAIFLQQSFFTSMNSFNAHLQTDSSFRHVNQDFAQMMGAMRAFMIFFSLGFAGLFVWIIFRLMSYEVRLEFGATGRAA